MYGNLSNENVKKLDRARKVAQRITHTELPTIGALYEKKILLKIHKLMQDSSHPLHELLKFNSSGICLTVPKTIRCRFRQSFVPNAIHIFNNSVKRWFSNWVYVMCGGLGACMEPGHNLFSFFCPLSLQHCFGCAPSHSTTLFSSYLFPYLPPFLYLYCIHVPDFTHACTHTCIHVNWYVMLWSQLYFFCISCHVKQSHFHDNHFSNSWSLLPCFFNHFFNQCQYFKC